MFIKPTTTSVLNKVAKITNLSNTVIASQLREMEYIPKYLEIAKLKGQYRFNEKEIKELTSSFSSYVTNGSKVDILKDILSIGASKGEMLSVEEIKNLLKVSSSYEMKGQQNIIRFVKYAQEALRKEPPKKRTLQEIKKEYPYAMFKIKELSLFPKSIKKNKEYYSEAQITKRYENFIDYLQRSESSPSYLRVQKMNNNNSNPLRFINKREGALIDAIASSDEPEMFAELVELIGPTNAVKYSGNSMLKLYKMIKSPNVTLLPLVSENFYPAEIKIIVDALTKKSTNGKGTVIKNLFEKVDNCRNINQRRRVILTELGIQDDVVLPQIKLEYVKPLRKLPGSYGSRQ